MLRLRQSAAAALLGWQIAERNLKLACDASRGISLLLERANSRRLRVTMQRSEKQLCQQALPRPRACYREQHRAPHACPSYRMH